MGTQTPPPDPRTLRFLQRAHIHVRVELLGEDQVGGRPGDGDEAAYGGGVGDAERQALADHVISLRGVLGVPPHLYPLYIWDFNSNLRE